MGYALWVGPDRAWAQGTMEYRAWGCAVIAATDLFRLKDFRPGLHPPDRTDAGFAGYFPSLGAVNRDLIRRRARHAEASPVTGSATVRLPRGEPAPDSRNAQRRSR